MFPVSVASVGLYAALGWLVGFGGPLVSAGFLRVGGVGAVVRAWARVGVAAACLYI